MQHLIERLRAWQLPDWRRQLSETPESLAQRHPNLYLSGAVLLALVGHVLSLGFPLTVLALLIGLPDALGSALHAAEWPWLILHLAVMTGAALMTAFLWRQKIPLPAGRPLQGKERLPIEELIQDFQADAVLSCPSEVRVTEHHQLSSICVPRNGFPLFNRRVLLLGLPTLQALTTKQAAAAIRRALSRPNSLKGRILLAVARQHECTRQYHAAYRSQPKIAARIMETLFRLHLAACNGWSGPALRWNELEHDTLLNQQICLDSVLELLAVDTLVRRYLHEIFWPTLLETAKHDAEPPHPHASLKKMLHEQLTQKVINRWLAEAMHAAPSEDALNPTLAERLANLGSRRLEPISLGSENAAEALLRESLGSVIRQLDRIWRLGVRRHWRQEYGKHAKYRARLSTLRQRALTQDLHGRDALMLAKLAKHYLPAEEAVSVYQQLARMNPNDAKILVGLGRRLLAHGLEEGSRLLRRAVRLGASQDVGDDEPLAQVPKSSRAEPKIESTTSSAA